MGRAMGGENPKHLRVRLSLAEIQLAYFVAGQRQVYNLKHNAKQRFGGPEGLENAAHHLTGARAEMAVAKAFNLYWPGELGDYRAADVGNRVEVRSVHKRTHSLIIHPDDKDDLPYVLADVSGITEIVLLGWIKAGEAKIDRYWSDPSGKARPAFFVPPEDLLPMSNLLGLGE